MRIRENLKKDFRIFIFSLKNIKFIAVIPIIIILGLLPTILLLTYKQYQDPWYVNEQFVVWSQLLVPLFSIWNILFSFINIIENDGNELHYINHRMKDNIIWMWFVVGVTVVGILCMLVNGKVENVFLEYMRLCISSLFYTMFAYLLMYSTNSMTITFLGVVCYWLMSTFGNSIPFTILNCYDTQFMTIDLLCSKYLYIFGIAMLMYIVAYWFNKRKEIFL